MAILGKSALYPIFGGAGDASLATLWTCGPSDAATVAKWSLLEAQLAISNGLMVSIVY